MLTFFVPGIPKTKGSTRSFYNPKAKKIVTMGACKQEKSWEGIVSFYAGQAGVALSEHPIQIWLSFRFARPKCHFNKKGLKLDAPEKPTGRKIGDIDKLERAILDSLTGIAYYDDSQVWAVSKSKQWIDEEYGEVPGVKISIK